MKPKKLLVRATKESNLAVGIPSDRTIVTQNPAEARRALRHNYLCNVELLSQLESRPHFYKLHHKSDKGIKNKVKGKNLLPTYFTVKQKNRKVKCDFFEKENKELLLRFFVSSALLAPLAILVELDLFSDEFLVLA